MTATIVFVSVVVLAFYHFIYEGAIGPSIRMHIRNELFALRDELRAIQAEGVGVHDEPAFMKVHDGLNFLLRSLGMFTLALGAHADETYKVDLAFKERVDEKLRLVRECCDPRIRAIHRKASRLVQLAFIANAGGWLIYIVPIGVCVFALSKATSLAMRLALTSESDARRVMQDEMSAV